MVVGNLALTVAAVFTGAAFYVSFAEQTARLTLDDRALLAEWKPAYERGYAMQAPLAILGFLLGLDAWWLSGRAGFVAGALLMAANWPWTLFVIMPTNKAIMAIRLEDASAHSRSLIIKWNKLHSVRTMLGTLAIAGFIVALASK
jgi:Domain of unknown function (DUF1772)